MHKFNDNLNYLDSGGGQCAIDLSKVKLDKTSLGKICLSMYYNKTACVGMNLKYRSPDGSCNNLKRSYSGKASTAYKRLLFNNYRDSFIGKLYTIIIYLCAYIMMGFHLLSIQKLPKIFFRLTDPVLEG